MEKKEVVLSKELRKNLENIYDYGVETFGEVAAMSFILDVYDQLEKLGKSYNRHPECRHLVTKSHMYRNIILGAYIILYRVKPGVIEVLLAYHSSRSVARIKEARKIRP